MPRYGVGGHHYDTNSDTPTSVNNSHYFAGAINKVGNAKATWDRIDPNVTRALELAARDWPTPVVASNGLENHKQNGHYTNNHSYGPGRLNGRAVDLGLYGSNGRLLDNGTNASTAGAYGAFGDMARGHDPSIRTGANWGDNMHYDGSPGPAGRYANTYHHDAVPTDKTATYMSQAHWNNGNDVGDWRSPPPTQSTLSRLAGLPGQAITSAMNGANAVTDRLGFSSPDTRSEGVHYGTGSLYGPPAPPTPSFNPDLFSGDTFSGSYYSPYNGDQYGTPITGMPASDMRAPPQSLSQQIAAAMQGAAPGAVSANPKPGELGSAIQQMPQPAPRPSVAMAQPRPVAPRPIQQQPQLPMNSGGGINYGAVQSGYDHLTNAFGAVAQQLGLLNQQQPAFQGGMYGAAGPQSYFGGSHSTLGGGDSHRAL